MGVYNSVYLKKRCPYCHEVSKMEFQTKDGKYIFMNRYKVGDKYDKGQFRRINAIGSCRSLTCQLEEAKESVWKYGYYGGWSRSFSAYIYCDSKGRITNKIKIYRLDNHKRIMRGRLGELKGKEDNMKIVKYWHYDKKLKRGIEAKMKPMTTNGWLDKFKKEKYWSDIDQGREGYAKIMYLFNLEDEEYAFRLWFLFRHKLRRIIEFLKKELKIKNDGEFASIFLSNNPEELYNIIE